jgi:hypothetical protein
MIDDGARIQEQDVGETQSISGIKRDIELKKKPSLAERIHSARNAIIAFCALIGAILATAPPLIAQFEGVRLEICGKINVSYFCPVEPSVLEWAGWQQERLQKLAEDKSLKGETSAEVARRLLVLSQERDVFEKADKSLSGLERYVQEKCEACQCRKAAEEEIERLKEPSSFQSVTDAWKRFRAFVGFGYGC